MKQLYYREKKKFVSRVEKGLNDFDRCVKELIVMISIIHDHASESIVRSASISSGLLRSMANLFFMLPAVSSAFP